jgi:hypothetical protein
MAANPIDDIPIPVKTNGNQKTFEQMVEEELARHQAKEAGVQAAKAEALESIDTKKTYLKRKNVDTSARKGSNTTAKKN